VILFAGDREKAEVLSMSKRSAETQLTKDQMSGFSFSAGGGGGPDESSDPMKMATSETLSARK
jgi:hypothetical protein